MVKARRRKRHSRVHANRMRHDRKHRYSGASMEAIAEAASSAQVHNRCGQTELADVVDLLSICRGAVSNDSGLMHIAAATYLPTLGLFGPSREEIYAPWGEHCASVRTKLSFAELAASPGMSSNR